MTDYSAMLTSERLAKTYSQLLKKGSVLEQVVANLGLSSGLAGNVDVTIVRDTQLIDLSVEDTDPVLAMRIANEIPKVFAAQNQALQGQRYASSKESLLAQMDKFQADIQRTEAAIAALQESGGGPDEIAELQTTVATYRGSYVSLLKSYEEIRVVEAQEINDVILIEAAKVPEKPVSPRVLPNTLLAGVVGAMLTLGVAFLIEYLDDTLKTQKDVEEALAIPTLGAIIQIDGIAGPKDQVVALTRPRSPFAEAYRILRTNFQYAVLGNPAYSILVTSPGLHDGKTITSANLAVTLAQTGKSVILVDADLRQPSLHELFGLEIRPGLTHALVDGCPVEEILKPTGVDGLRLLTSGALPPNPAELLDSEPFRGLLGELARRAEVMILDSPPILAFADASILASQVTGTLLVIAAGNSRIQTSQRAKEALEATGAKILGAVLNKLPPGRAEAYYYFYDKAGKRPKRRHT